MNEMRAGAAQFAAAGAAGSQAQGWCGMSGGEC